jgi:hypothetical protein
VRMHAEDVGDMTGGRSASISKMGMGLGRWWHWTTKTMNNITILHGVIVCMDRRGREWILGRQGCMVSYTDVVHEEKEHVPCLNQKIYPECLTLRLGEVVLVLDGHPETALEWRRRRRHWWQACISACSWLIFWHVPVTIGWCRG